MKKHRFLFILFVTWTVLAAQVGPAFAASALQEGNPTATVTDLACGTDGTTVIVTYVDENSVSQEVKISLDTAVTLGLIAENTECNDAALADGIGDLIDPALATPVEEDAKHPVGAALAAFFGDIADYDAIMEAHENGTGFGVIAQALWLVKKSNGALAFEDIISAKKSGDFGAFELEDGTRPKNWGQFKKEMFAGDKKNNLGAIMSEKNKDKIKDHPNNGVGSDNKNKNKP